MKDRISRWKNPYKYPLFISSFEDDEVREIFHKRWNADKSSNKKLTSLDLLHTSKELIFNIVDEKPVFHVINYSLDTFDTSLVVQHGMDIEISGDSEEEITKEIVNTLAMAAVADVPVYPNTENLAESLASYHKILLLKGFTAPNEKGEPMKLKLTKYPNLDPDKIGDLLDIRFTEMYSPADLAIIKNVVSERLMRLDRADRVLTTLQIAITELEDLLKSSRRNENKLQKCLTNNPILFGFEYYKVIPKHQLGSEFETDYVLERNNGALDVLEIESSNLPLFTKDGNPTKYLVHAEQQVLDWLNWIETNSSYARTKLPRLMSPKGYVIIGLSASLSETDSQKLQRRNLVFSGALQILTFDDLLTQAKNMLVLLDGRKQSKSSE